MRYFFQGKMLIYLTLTILFIVGLSVIYQVFFVKSHAKDIYEGISNSSIIKQKDKISDTIFDFGYEHDYVFYLFKKYNSGCYFGHDNEGLNEELNGFIKLGKTVILKKENDSIVYFINKDDTMSVLFDINKQNMVLCNWRKI